MRRSMRSPASARPRADLGRIRTPVFMLQAAATTPFDMQEALAAFGELRGLRRIDWATSAMYPSSNPPAEQPYYFGQSGCGSTDS